MTENKIWLKTVKVSDRLLLCLLGHVIAMRMKEAHWLVKMMMSTPLSERGSLTHCKLVKFVCGKINPNMAQKMQRKIFIMNPTY